MKYFVTGATGFVGGRVVRQLAEAGHEVGIVVRNPAKAKDLVDLGIAVYRGDVTDKESMRKANDRRRWYLSYCRLVQNWREG